MIRFIVNPEAGRGRSRRSLDRMRHLAAGSGADVIVSRSADDLRELGRSAVAGGIDRVVVAGGDGSLHHVAQALVGSRCALAVVPLGRGNDFAADLGIPTDLEAAVACALSGPERRIDVGQANGHYFLAYCGMGFDSESARFARAAPAVLGGSLAYIYGVLRTLATFEPPFVEVSGSGNGFRGRAMFVVVCNTSRFGGGMRIAPEARCDDGVLDLVVARQLSRLALLRAFPKVYRGTHVGHPAVVMQRITDELSIRSDLPIGVACDGEAVATSGAEPLRIRLAAGDLRVVTPLARRSA